MEDNRSENDWSPLIRRAKSGEHAAYSEAVESLRVRLERIVAMLIGDWDEASSIVQETFLKGWQQLASFNEQGNLYSWLRGIAVNLSKQFLDKRRRQATVVDPTLLPERSMNSPSPKGMLSQLLSNEVNLNCG